VYDICVRTGASGGDATGRYSTDDLLPDLFAGPYLHLEPDLASVLADQSGVPVGYGLGTADTARFVRRYRAEWIPLLGDAYPVPPDPPGTDEERLLAGHFHPERRLRPGLENYPAHLHIDLLPAAHGQGHGRALIETFLAAAARAGARGVHLEMDPANTGARAFYDRVGFHELPIAGGGTYVGRALA
jgi:GNAT superfamily N-acetyltransferase